MRNTYVPSWRGKTIPCFKLTSWTKQDETFLADLEKFLKPLLLKDFERVFKEAELLKPSAAMTVEQRNDRAKLYYKMLCCYPRWAFEQAFTEETMNADRRFFPDAAVIATRCDNLCFEFFAFRDGLKRQRGLLNA